MLGVSDIGCLCKSDKQMSVFCQTMVWTRSLAAKHDLPSPSDCGWENTDDGLQPMLMQKDPAPKELVELTKCSCKKNACVAELCVCGRNGLPCTELCVCMADDSCQNSNNIRVDNDDGDDDDD